MSDSPKSKERRAFWLIARVTVTVAALTYLFSIINLKELVEAFAHISITAGIAVVVLLFAGVSVGAVRWRALLAAYGAPYRPSVLRLSRLYLVGLFCNTFFPGGVGGDVVRGIATRDAFGKGGTTSALAVVLVERVAGLSGLLLLTTTVFTLHPLPGVVGVRVWGAVGLLGAVGAVTGLALGRRLSRFFPGPLGRIAASLPEIHSLRPFILAIGLSVITQALGALSGHVLISSITSQVELADSFVVVPLAAAAVYFPFTIAGAGVREAAFIVLFRTVGVADADALAASLALLLCQIVVASTGGLFNLFIPLGKNQTS
jgi:uncharacterized membrane protein YbhN (UPF0104 family)